MSRDTLNPEQFGLLPFDEGVENDIGTSLPEGYHLPQRTKKLSLDQPLRASQPWLDPQAVEHYTEHPRTQIGAPLRNKNDPPMVVRHKGEDVIWQGHHRIVVARNRGQKTMRVQYRSTS